MSTRTVAVASSSGLHARPASIFTQAAASSGVDVLIAYGDDEPVDASSILLVMSLGVPSGAEVTLSADGPDADQIGRAHV